MRVSNSGIQCFKSCRRMYELKYIHGLEPVETAPSLERGIAYHELAESLLNGDSRPLEDCDNPKIKAMGIAFQKYIVSQLTEIIGVGATEKWFEFQTEKGFAVIGRIDGITTDNRIIEHKTTSSSIDGVYFQRLELDEQIPTYMLAMGADEIFYTVCQAPTIRQKKGESDEGFCQRCVDWYDVDTDHKITVVRLNKSKEELEKFANELDAIISEMQDCKNFYRNPGHCMKWGRMCEYAPVCLHYDPDADYIQFKKRERGAK